MHITNGWLDGVERWPAPKRVAPLKPTTIAIHFDVCSSLAGNTAAVFASGLFYHVAIDGNDRSGKLQARQYVPFDRQGSHVKGRNAETIGIAIVNPGPLVERNGELWTVQNPPRRWPKEDAIEAVHAGGLAPKEWRHWAAFHYSERDFVLGACAALIETYPTIGLICGHDYLDHGRKFDPGPAAETVIFDYVRGAFPNIRVPEAGEHL